MGNIVTVEANALLASSVAGSAYTAATKPIQLALITTTTPSTATAAGSEVTNAGGSTYARKDLVTSAPFTVFGSAASGSITNSAAAVSFTNMPACTIGGVEIWDSAGTPVRRWFGTLTANKVINLGDTVTFNTSSLSIALS